MLCLNEVCPTRAKSNRGTLQPLGPKAGERETKRMSQAQLGVESREFLSSSSYFGGAVSTPTVKLITILSRNGDLRYQ